jgi:hypothetical protein
MTHPGKYSETCNLETVSRQSRPLSVDVFSTRTISHGQKLVLTVLKNTFAAWNEDEAPPRRIACVLHSPPPLLLSRQRAKQRAPREPT